jgi:hypothetical protein
VDDKLKYNAVHGVGGLYQSFLKWTVDPVAAALLTRTAVSYMGLIEDREHQSELDKERRQVLGKIEGWLKGILNPPVDVVIAPGGEVERDESLTSARMALQRKLLEDVGELTKFLSEGPYAKPGTSSCLHAIEVIKTLKAELDEAMEALRETRDALRQTENLRKVEKERAVEQVVRGKAMANAQWEKAVDLSEEYAISERLKALQAQRTALQVLDKAVKDFEIAWQSLKAEF